MQNLVIIGGGFAGLWSAFSAVRAAKFLNKFNETNITLINKDPYHGLRPRFYEAKLDNNRLLLNSFLKPLGVSLIIDEVISINTNSQEITLKTNTKLTYDHLIIAAGSQLTVPNIPGLSKYSFNIDTFTAAEKLQQHINLLPNQKNTPGQYTIVVAGGGFTGIEAATDFINRLTKIAPKNKNPRVIIIDHHKVAGKFSEEAQQVIFTALHDLHIETISGLAIQAISHNSVTLSNNRTIPTSTLVWTAGMQSSELTTQIKVKLDPLGRLPVDRYLRIQTISNCFAAGDVAAATTDGEHLALLSCQHAMPQGRFAGNNAIASMFNSELLMYEQPKYVTCLDLGSWGALYTEGWDQKVINIKDAAKKIKLFINHHRINPPEIVGKNIDNLLEAANPIFKPIKL